MKILLAHPVYPGQFGLLSEALAQDNNDVAFLAHVGHCASERVRLERYALANNATAGVHSHLTAVEQAMLHAEGALHHAVNLKRRGFVPDVIVGHAGFGQLALMREVFPAARIIAYAEYFYHSYGADVGFDPALAISTSDYPRVRLKNAATLLSLDCADAAYSPTAWQRNLFPSVYRNHIAVIHDGIDTDQFRRSRRKAMRLPSGRVLGRDGPLITFAARALEHYRGFHKFWPALASVLNRLPNAEALIVGAAVPAYGPEDEQNLLQRLLPHHECDLRRVCFADSLSRTDYIAMLQASSCHVYLSYPFVPSWSLVEAMACRTPLVVGDVAPVREIVGADTALVVDFFDEAALADAIERTLTDRRGAQKRARRAWERATSEYDFKRKIWPKLRRLLIEKNEGVGR